MISSCGELQLGCCMASSAPILSCVLCVAVVLFYPSIIQYYHYTLQKLTIRSFNSHLFYKYVRKVASFFSHRPSLAGVNFSLAALLCKVPRSLCYRGALRVISEVPASRGRIQGVHWVRTNPLPLQRQINSFWSNNREGAEFGEVNLSLIHIWRCRRRG